jgi:hypothetical protein
MMILRIRRIGMYISLNIKPVYPGSIIDNRRDMRRKREADNQVISQEIMACLVYHVNNHLCLYRFLNLFTGNTGRSGVFRSKRNSLSTRTIFIWFVNLLQVRRELTNSGGIWYWPPLPSAHNGDSPDRTESTIYRSTGYFLYTSNPYCVS